MCCVRMIRLRRLNYEKICEKSDSFNDAPAFTARMAGQTMDGEILEGRYYSNYVLCKNDIYVNLTYHYYDEGLIMHGWDSTQWTMENWKRTGRTAICGRNI